MCPTTLQTTPGELGKWGEALAVQYLEGLGWPILAKNWRGKRGELDVIGFDGSELVAVEVKTRSSQGFGHPSLAVSAAKLRRIGGLLAQWLTENTVRATSLRIDVIAIIGTPSRQATVEHFKGVQL